MSFLSNLIKCARKDLLASNPDLKAVVGVFKKAIIDNLQALQKEDNLKLFDNNNGGVMRGPKKSRGKCENKETGNVFCQKQYLFDGKLEVPYFRSVFNSQAHKFTINANSESIVRLIGYESPLMRKKSGMSSRAISCDLVGLTSNNQVLCIEGKVKPHGSATDIAYGLLESFAYGVCVEYFLSEKRRLELFKNEVRACLKEFHPTTSGLDEKPVTAAFTLAAPKEYFSEYFKPVQTGSDRAHRNLKEKVEKQLATANKLLAAFREINGPEWVGFLIIDSTCSASSFAERNSRTLKNKTYIEPHFKTDLLKVHLAKDVDVLRQALGLQGVAS